MQDIDDVYTLECNLRIGWAAITCLYEAHSGLLTISRNDPSYVG